MHTHTHVDAHGRETTMHANAANYGNNTVTVIAACIGDSTVTVIAAGIETPCSYLNA